MGKKQGIILPGMMSDITKASQGRKREVEQDNKAPEVNKQVMEEKVATSSKGRSRRNEDYKVASYVVNIKKDAKIRFIARAAKMSLKDMLERMQDHVIDNYEKEHGEIVLSSKAVNIDELI